MFVRILFDKYLFCYLPNRRPSFNCRCTLNYIKMIWKYNRISQRKRWTIKQCPNQKLPPCIRCMYVYAFCLCRDVVFIYFYLNFFCRFCFGFSLSSKLHTWWCAYCYILTCLSLCYSYNLNKITMESVESFFLCKLKPLLVV